MSIGETEKKTQKKVMDFFSDRKILDFKNLGNLEDKANTNIKTDLLRDYLRSCGHDDTVIEKAIAKLVKTAGNIVMKMPYTTLSTETAMKYVFVIVVLTKTIIIVLIAVHITTPTI